MFELLRSSSPRELYGRHLPGLAIAFVVAELFYKWGSFALECMGFLATWLVIDLICSVRNSPGDKNAAKDHVRRPVTRQRGSQRERTGVAIGLKTDLPRTTAGD